MSISLSESIIKKAVISQAERDAIKALCDLQERVISYESLDNRLLAVFDYFKAIDDASDELSSLPCGYSISQILSFLLFIRLGDVDFMKASGLSVEACIFEDLLAE